ncbi:MAG: cation:proton antiporter [Dyadobacter sp.]|uniref:cation:proton antiporter domain-containing protein n=1 Tax=Dyadobacter sp. TaxID=1914288 RepID=UPI001B28906D|nr:cation:proton antiporter [Dyadobacter sp.]
MIDLIPFIFIVATLAVVSVLSDKVRIPYPILLVLVGLVIGFIPGLPLVELDPEVVFLLFLPPLLFRAGWNTSWPAFRAAIRPAHRHPVQAGFAAAVPSGGFLFGSGDQKDGARAGFGRGQASLAYVIRWLLHDRAFIHRICFSKTSAASRRLW